MTRIPGLVLGAVLLLLAFTLMPLVLLGAAGELHSRNGAEFSWLSLPALLVYPAAVVVAWALRRPTRPRVAWVAAGITLAVLLAASAAPTVVWAGLLHDQWAQYQPGGRGHVP